MTKVTAGTAEKSFVYDEQGSVLSTLTGDKSRSYLNYDNAGRLTSLLLQKVNLGTLGDYKYTYDANGNITAISYKGDSIGNGTISYTYDALNRLTKETLRDGSTKEYWYDSVGNRTKRVTTPASGAASTADYTYDEANQLKSVNSNTGYVYDKNGNMISDGSRNFEYDFNNRLIKVTNKSDDSPIADYQYDADGRRTATITPTATTKYYYDGTSNNVLYETDGAGNLLARYIYGTDYKPEVMIRGTNTYYYHYNGHGDVVALTDQNGTVVAEYDYDSYGIPVSTGREGTVINPYRYAGYRWDSETGFYYLNARYYWAEVGRFISKDTFHGFEDEPASLNQYTYAKGNPVTFIDPSGNVYVAATKQFSGYSIRIYLNNEETKKLIFGLAVGATSTYISGFIKNPVATAIGRTITYVSVLNAGALALRNGPLGVIIRATWHWWSPLTLTIDGVDRH